MHAVLWRVGMKLIDVGYIIFHELPYRSECPRISQRRSHRTRQVDGQAIQRTGKGHKSSWGKLMPILGHWPGGLVGGNIRILNLIIQLSQKVGRLIARFGV